MASPVILPRQGQSVESCIIIEWHKKVGDTVKEGDVLFSYETDKASFEEYAKEDGTMLAIFFEEDDDVPVLTTVGVIGKSGDDISSFKPEGDATADAKPFDVILEQPTEADSPKPEIKVQAPTGNVLAAVGVSPRARSTAKRLGIDPASALPSGPGGRIIERDIFEARNVKPAAKITMQIDMQASSAPSALSLQSGERTYQEVKLSNIRRMIGKTMHESLSQMAQLTHHTSFDAQKLLALRARFKASPAELNLQQITINDLILFAVSRTLKRHPDLNAHFLGDRLHLYDHVHLGVAVDTTRGLMVPSLFDADMKNLAQISRAAKELGSFAQSGSINPDLLTGGTFTVTNLGTLGIELFTPIINPPQVAILGVDCVVERVRNVNGHITTYPAMGLSLTYDHRAVDGAPASRFLRDLVISLENIDILTAE